MTSQEIATTTPNVALAEGSFSLDQLMELSRVMAVSSLLPAALKGKPADVLITIMYGQELGMTPMQSILGIYVVNGRPGLSGQTWLARVRKAGHRVKVSDHTEKSCTVTIVRGDSGEEHSETFTWADAERAKLTGKDVWKSWPKRMLLWRAVTSCATVICPEVASGFDMTEAMLDAEPKPTLAQVAAERADAIGNGTGGVAEAGARDVTVPVDDAEIAEAYAEIEREHTTAAEPAGDALFASDGE